MAKYKSPEMVWTSQDLSHELASLLQTSKLYLLEDVGWRQRTRRLRRISIREARGRSEISGGSEKVRRVLCSAQKPHHGRFEVQLTLTSRW